MTVSLLIKLIRVLIFMLWRTLKVCIRYLASRVHGLVHSHSFLNLLIHPEELLAWAILFRDNLVSIRVLLYFLLLLKFLESTTSLFSCKLPCFLQMILPQVS